MVSQDIAKAKISFNEGFVYFKQNTVLGYLMKIKKKIEIKKKKNLSNATFCIELTKTYLNSIS